MKKLVISLLSVLLFVSAAFAQSDLQPLAVIKVNKSETITVKQLKARCETYEKQMGKALTVDERKKVLDSLIEEKLVMQAATKAGISIPDSTADQYFLQNMAQQVGAQVTEKELSDMVLKAEGVTLDQLLQQQTGMNVAEYKNFLKIQLTIQQYILYQKQNELQKLAPTDEEIRLFYESNKASFVQNDTAKLFLIIVPKGKDNDKAKLLLNNLRNQYVDKKLSSEQIVLQSRQENSGYQAGELLLPKTETYAVSLGMTYNNLVNLFSQKEGFVSDIEETANDYRVISILKKYGAKMLAISDVVQPETTVTVYDYIRSNLAQQKQQAYISTAAVEVAASLNTDSNVERKKTGDALTKLLDWGN